MIQIKVDGKVLFKGSLGDWESKPPDEFKDMIRPGVKPLPYMKALLITMADAVVSPTDLRINILTSPTGWEMKVRYA